MKKSTTNSKKIAKQLKNTPKMLLKGGSKLSKEIQEGINEFIHFLMPKENIDDNNLCYTYNDLLSKYENFKSFKDEQTNEKLREKFSMFIKKLNAINKENLNEYDKTVFKLLQRIEHVLQEALAPIYDYDDLIFLDNTDEKTGKTYKLLTVLNDKIILTDNQKIALDKYNKKLKEILDLFIDFDRATKNNERINIDTLSGIAENFYSKVELAKPILNEQLILIDQMQADTREKEYQLSTVGTVGTVGGKRGKALGKYKSTGQAVYILYKNKKCKRTIYVKDKGITKYCKIDYEYVLLSKLKVIE